MENQEVVLSVDAIQEPEQIKFNMSLKNQSERAVEFQFSTGQKFELVVYDSENKERYRYSKDKMFTQAFQNLTLEPGETYDFSDVWKEVSEPGTYEVKVTFKGRAENLKQVQAVQQFEVK
ncbi:intracellular proteinase inhibitor [Bacillus inaquosorum]|nr:intracellular proteinase inhibitor [Bacillus inaquosorum]MEC0604998.1 intracellular proteinase inhibitor [Bacillus inaquosorum]